MMKWIWLFLLSVLAFGFVSFTPQHQEILGVNEAFYSGKQDTIPWVVDKSRSEVSFAITHLVVSTAEGIFKSFEGSMKSTRPDFSDAQISFTVDVASVDTDSEGRDEHLRGADYFNAEKYPRMRFESTSFKPAGSKKYKLSGNLTIKGVTKSVVFDVISTGSATKPVFTCTTSINRYDYNMTAGAPAVGKEVTITVKVEMTR